MRISIVLFLVVFIVFSGCQQSKKIRIATSLKGSSTEKVGNEIAEYLNEIGWEVEIYSGEEYFGSKNIKAIENNVVDCAFISNDLPHDKNTLDIQTVMPLFPNLCYIFYRDHLTPKNFEELITNNSLMMASDENGNFFISLFEYYGINTDSLNIEQLNIDHSVEDVMQEIYSSKSNVICLFAAIHNPHVKKLIENGWEIFSLGDISFSNRGSSVEGFCMNYPRTKPFIIPKNFFGQKPTYPIYTVSTNELIVTRSSMDETLIYEFVKDVYEGKHYLSQNEILFTHIKEDFDNDALNYPLHQGAINYLERDKPSFFERYAEVFGVIFSIMVVLYGAFTSLKKIRKERIDKYYKRAMEIQTLEELDELSQEAVRQLQNEKLTADESFTIFLNLVDKRRHEIEIGTLNKI